MVSIIVPTLNEENGIAETLRSLIGLAGQKEILVSDGGSEDQTEQIAQSLGVRVIRGERGRGCQLHAGASAASGNILWFVHADTRAEAGAIQGIEQALRNSGVAGGDFTLVFEGSHYSARQMTRIYPYLRWLGLSYGDAGIFIKRQVYDEIGGCRPYPLFEDLDLIRRMRRQGRFVHLKERIFTSSRRFAGPQYARVWALWIGLQILYWAGVSPYRLSRWYRHAR